MSWEKSRLQLQSLLEGLESIPDKEQYFIKWFKINRICKESLQKLDLNEKHKQTVISLLEKYKKVIQPALTKFIKEQKDMRMKDLLQHYTEKMLDLFAMSEENLKILPLASLELLEDSLFFVDLYKFTLSNDLITLSKNAISKKIALLKQTFEVEAGSKDLEKRQKQMTETYKSQITGTPFPEPLPLPAVKSEISPDITNETGLGQISFPEEPQPGEIHPNQAQSYQPAISNIPIQIDYSQNRSPQGINRVYSLVTWNPRENWDQFLTFRYSASTGQIQKS